MLHEFYQTNLMQGAWQVVKVVIAGESNIENSFVVELVSADFEVHTLDFQENYAEEEESPRFLWFDKEIIITGDEWAAWDMPYQLQCDRSPMEIDITRNDLQQSWLQKCIFEISGDVLQICGSGLAILPRPSAFTSSITNQQILYVANRCNEPRPD
jgi:hypothetical protein